MGNNLVIVSIILVVINSGDGENSDPAPVESSQPTLSSSESSSVESSSSSESSSESSSSSVQSSSSTSSRSSQSFSVGGDTLTGGPNTPASRSKQNNDSEIPASWLAQQFAVGGLNDQGECSNASLCSPEADPDNDDLTNLEEYNYGTDPQEEDTDSDGVSDGNEVYVYYSSPTNSDSDTDGDQDGDELAECTDPIVVSQQKISGSRLNVITRNAGLKPLTNATIKTLRDAGANRNDIDKGYINSKCTSISVEL